jgi:MFS family permease
MLARQLGLPRIRGSEGFLIAIFIDALGSGLFLPFSLLYFHEAAGLPLVMVGFALSIATIFTLPIAPFTGWLVDRFGSRYVVIVSQLLQSAGFLGYLVVNSAATLIAFALLAGIGQRMFWSAYFTLVADIAEPSERDRWYGLAGAAQNIGLALGGPLAGLLVADAGLLGYRIVVIINCVSFLFAAALLLFSVHTKRPQQHEVAETGGYRTLMRDRPFLVLTLTGVLYALGSMFFSLGIPIYITSTLHQPAWVIGFVLAFNTILLAAMQTIVVRHLELYRRTRALMLVGLLLGIWCGTTALAIWIPSWLLLPYLFGITCIYTLGELISAPTSSALVASASPDALRGRYLAFFQFSWSIASIVAPGLFTTLFSFTPTLPWLVVGVLMLLASLSIYRLEAHLPKRAIYIMNSYNQTREPLS